MIKFTASGNGVTLIGLGFEPENLTRMVAGQPIRIRLADLGFEGPVGAIHLMLFSGSSVEAMMETLQPFIGDDTVTHEEP